MTLLSVKYLIPFSSFHLFIFCIRMIRTDLKLGFFLRIPKPCSLNIFHFLSFPIACYESHLKLSNLQCFPLLLTSCERLVIHVATNESEGDCAASRHTTGFSLTHPPVDDPLSVQEKQTNGNLCSIKPAKLKCSVINTHVYENKCGWNILRY